jgi:hypothetical protein
VQRSGSGKAEISSAVDNRDTLSSTRMGSRLSQWIARAGAAAFFLALLEIMLVLGRAAYVRGDVFGLACLFVCLFALFSFWSAWIALVLALIEHKRRSWRTAGAPIIYAAMAGVALASVALVWWRARVERVGLDQPHIVSELELWSNAVIVLGAFVTARLFFYPFFLFLERRLPRLFASVRLARVLACLAAAAVALRAASSGFEPLYLSPLAGIAGVFASFMLLLAARQVFAEPPRWLVRAAIGSVLIAMVIAPIGSCHQPTAAFALHNAAFVAAPLVRLLEISADLDGDGTASTIFGGTDCDEGDPRRGGGITEIPGDGIDQDCRGGDAPVRELKELEVSLFEHCELPQRPLSILVITIDAWRGDRLARWRTPDLWGFAERSVIYRRAYTPATTNAMSFPAIMTGAPASQIGTGNLNLSLRLRMNTHVAVQLEGTGFLTAAYSALTQPGGNIVGFANDFPWYRDSVPAPLGTKGLFNSAMVSSNAMAFLTVAREPFFFWVHYADPQAPHLDPQLSATRFRNATNYDREVAYADVHVGKLLRFFRGLPLADRTAVFIMGSHGQDLGGRGRYGHGRDVFEDTTHVPLIMRIPGCPPRIVPEPVSLLQVAPTIAWLTGIERAGVPLFPAKDLEPQVLVTEAVEATYFNRAIVSGRFKLIEDVQGSGRLLFDLENDPLEQNNLYGEEPELVARIEAEYQRWLDGAANRIKARK